MVTLSQMFPIHRGTPVVVRVILIVGVLLCVARFRVLWHGTYCSWLNHAA